MTISSTVRRAGPYAGNGIATSFPFDFKVFLEAELVVTQAVLATGIESVLVLDTDYVVVLNVDQNTNPGGSITFPISGSPMASTHTLTLTSGVEEKQETDIQNAGGFFPEVIEDALDRAMIVVQQLNEENDRALRFPVSDTVVDGTLPTISQRANKVQGYDASGAPIAVANVPTSGVSATAYAETLLDDANAAAARATLGSTTVGDAVFIAATAAAARTAIDSPSNAEAILKTFAAAKGDLFGASANDTPVIIPAGADGTIPMARSAAAPGLAYVAALNGAGYGFIWSHGTDVTNDFDISVGGVMDDTMSYWMNTAAALGKQADVVWAVGGTPAAPAGMLDVGAIADGEYYLWQIARSDTGVVDVICSLTGPRGDTATMTIASPCVVTQTKHGRQVGAGVVFSTTGALPTGIVAGTRYFVIAAGLTADAYQIAATQGGAAINTSGSQSGVHTASGSPTTPASYDKKRVRGYFRRLAGVNTLLNVYETEGGGVDVQWRAPTLDINQANTLTNNERTDPVKVPLNFSVIAHLNVVTFDAAAGTQTWMRCPDQTDAAASGTAAPLNNIAFATGAPSGVQIKVRTSAAGLIAARSNLATVDLYAVSTMGFTWARRN